MIFQCSKCLKKFAKSYTLERHMNMVHHSKTTHDKKFACQRCSAKYTRHDNLKRHMKNIHSVTYLQNSTMKWTKRCCGKMFYSPASYRSHCHNQHIYSRSVNSIPVQRYCGISDTSTSSGEQNQDPGSPLTAQSDNVDSATLSGSGFDNDSLLDGIMADVPSTSSGIRNSDPGAPLVARFAHCSDSEDSAPPPAKKKYNCSICGAGFQRKRQLRLHVDSRHSLVPYEQTSESSSDEKVKKTSKKYQCSQCVSSFDRKSTLQLHIDLRHNMSPHPRMSNVPESPPPEQVLNMAAQELKYALKTPTKLFKILGDPIVRKSKKFKATEYDTEYALSELSILLCEAGFSYEVMEVIILHLTAKANPRHNQNGYIRVCLDAHGLDFPISVEAVKVKDFSPQLILNRIQSVLTSKATFPIDGPMKINIVFINDAEYGIRLHRHHVESGENYLQRKKGCWDPRTQDDYSCLGCCIVAAWKIAESSFDKKRKPRWFRMPAEDRPEFQEEVYQLYRNADIDPRTPQGYDDLRIFQEYLNKQSKPQQLYIYEGWNSYKCHFKGQPDRNHKERIYISVYNDHFYLIYNQRLFFNRDSICDKCGTTYWKKNGHSCGSVSKCNLCFDDECKDPSKNPVSCIFCGISYKNQLCFLLHDGGLQCAYRQRCDQCGKIYDFRNSSEEHPSCGMKHCFNCKEKVPLDHLCKFLPPTKLKAKGPDKFLLVAFDLETYLSTPDPVTGRKELKPYLATAVVFCEICIDSKEWSPSCFTCGIKKRTFWGDKIDQFYSWLFWGLRCDVPDRKVVAIAHNSSRFDTILLLNYLLQRGITPKVTFRGTQCLELNLYGNVRVKDFCTYVPAPLDSLPKTFGLDKEMTTFAKGFFPHSFLTNPEKLKYKGAIPPVSYFATERYTKQQRLNDFNAWYDLKKAEVYKLKKEAQLYCTQDTEILARSVQHFRKSVLQITNDQVDPIIGSSKTLAGMVSDIYRTMFMPESGIGLMPRLGYGAEGRKQSVMAIKYLECLNMQRQEQGLCRILHAGNNPTGEHKVSNFKVDGITTDGAEAFEKCGCFFHAHECLSQKKEKIHPLFGIPYEDVSNYTSFRHSLISNKIKLDVIYECEIKKEIQINKELKKYWNCKETRRRFANPIQMRDPLFGGRTESFCTSVQLTEQEIMEGVRIHYLDFVSLYPSVQKKNVFSTALHPEILTKSSDAFDGVWTKERLQSYFGFVSCFILPPEDLLIPVLPLHIRDKCVFTLCQKCASENEQREFCQHGNDERCLLGCWTTVDLQDALTYGYRILEVYEIWNWGHQPLTSDLFAPFVNTILKQKIESGGCPSGETVTEIVEAWKEKEQITIDPDKLLLPKNNAMYTTSKLIANSLWGKMAEYPRRSKTEFFSEWPPFAHLMHDRSKEITDVTLLNAGRSLSATYHLPEIDCYESPVQNLFIASLVTAYARRELNYVLQRLGPRLLYCDTDSVIFLHRPGQWHPKAGNTLGLLSNELGPGEFISRFQVLSPKNYRFEVSKESAALAGVNRVELKCKGQILTLPIQNSISGDLYDCLIEHRVHEVEQFYEHMLEKGELESAVARARSVHQQMKRKNQDFCGVFLPNPTLMRNKKTSCIFTDTDRVRLLRSSFDKRRLFLEAARGSMQSLPFGFRIPL